MGFDEFFLGGGVGWGEGIGGDFFIREGGRGVVPSRGRVGIEVQVIRMGWGGGNRFGFLFSFFYFVCMGNV